ncbi:MAG: hypothetical protein ACFB14_22415 [Leptolyngbyaceae cyanobacterium]
MGASDKKGTESEEIIRELVIPDSEVEPGSDPDDDRSPSDEETRDMPVEPLPDDGDDEEAVRKLVVPDES